jgi:hypothetical protein
MSESPARLFCILARKEPRAVILRRGPSRWVQLILWHTDRDEFEYGQWFHGRIYERRCDLSPDGRLFVYFASKFNASTVRDRVYTYAWTAVSRPPYFTALALWPKGDCWAGGGLFEDNRSMMLNHGSYQATPHPDHGPRGLKVTPNPHTHGEDGPIYFRRLARDGWQQVQEPVMPYVGGNQGWRTEKPGIWEKPSPDGTLTLIMTWTGINFEAFGGPYQLTFSIRQKKGTPIPVSSHATWADWDQRGRLVCAEQGRLAEARLQKGEVTLDVIADFNDRKPEAIKPPDWASDWKPTR